MEGVCLGSQQLSNFQSLGISFIIPASIQLDICEAFSNKKKSFLLKLA